ncbi:MAG: hypothetical protein ACI8T1_000001 [Verrucomicrobiales bacterium]|jgi:hypothetical protein
MTQRELSLHINREILLNQTSSEIVVGTKRYAPDPPLGHGIDLPMGHLGSISAILPLGIQVALECNEADEENAVVQLGVTLAGLRNGA